MMTHLHPKTAQLLALPNPARIEKILLDKWIPYTRAQSVLDKLANLYAHPTIDRMPNMLLTGEAGNGKTTLLKRYSRQFQPYIQPDTGKMQWHVLYINAPDEPDERRLYYKLFDLIGEVVSKGERLAHQQSKLLRILKSLGVKMLIIDESQHILAGGLIKQRLFLNIIKTLSNELCIPLVCAGMPAAANAIQRDEQLRSRFPPERLPLWELDADYMNLLQSFELLLPLKKPSNLTQESLAIKILALTEGTIGEISILLKEAAITAIESGKEHITSSILKSTGYVPPSKRG